MRQSPGITVTAIAHATNIRTNRIAVNSQYWTTYTIRFCTSRLSRTCVCCFTVAIPIYISSRIIKQSRYDKYTISLRLTCAVAITEYINSAVITPLFLVSGTFFPLDSAPEWAQRLAYLNPLYHCVELVRDAVFVQLAWVDLAHVAVLCFFAALMGRLAIRTMRLRLIG